ncbi:type II toxin-antitoxin system VapC family toxin [Sphingomonas sp.]|uniref:type II toxin-antitoxin system VapC family toxin n=1 Tax=Sphingomonas sp. TaxID=28214 RepID=UPI0035C79315
MIYLLDTNVVSDLVRNPQGVVASAISAAGEDRIVTSIIVSAELWFGAERSGSRRIARQLEVVLARIPILPFSDDADRHYASVRAALQRQGTPISGNDVLIAAHALAINATLVTGNLREFERVGGLRLVNWLHST